MRYLCKQKNTGDSVEKKINKKRKRKRTKGKKKGREVGVKGRKRENLMKRERERGRE